MTKEIAENAKHLVKQHVQLEPQKHAALVHIKKTIEPDKVKPLKAPALCYDATRLAKLQHKRLRLNSKGQAIFAEAFAVGKFGAGLEGLPREMFARIYQPNTQRLECDQPTVPQRFAALVHKALDDCGQLESLQRICRGNAALAFVAANQLAANVIQSVDLPDAQDIDKELNEKGRAGSRRVRSEAIKRGMEQFCDSAEGSRAERAAMRNAVGDACEHTQQVAEGMQKVAGQIAGNSAGGQMSQDLDEINQLQAAAANESLQRLLGLIGAFGDLFTREQGTAQGNVEPFSVQPGRNLRTILPAERLHLVLPETQDLALKRLQDGSLMQYALQDIEDKTGGNFTVWLDNSGSMSGRTLETAKAFAAAAILQAANDKRTCRLFVFNSTTRELPTGDLQTTAGRTAFIQSIAGIGATGGTSLVDCARALEEDGKQGDAQDVLLVSDGHVHGQEKECVQNALEGAQARLAYLHIGKGPGMRFLVECAHAYASVDTLQGLENADNAAGVAASLLR